MDEEKPVALVTGADGGIGRALVTEFRLAGYRVVATDIVSAPENPSAEYYIEADVAKTVRDKGYATRIFKTIREALGDARLRVLINNAAVQILGGTEQVTRQDWYSTIDVNLLAPFVWTQELLPELEAAQGSVVNISSVHARLTKRAFVAYATSKAALSGLTRAMAVDLGGRVRINAIEPAAIETDMLKAGFKGSTKDYDRLVQCHPIGRIGWPSEVAKFAVLLADDRFSFIHGACISLDGGVASRLFDPD